MSLSSGNKSGDKFNFYFQKSITQLEPRLKKNLLRHNNSPFMTKNLRKQIMVRSKLRNNYNKNRNYENWCKYKLQRNLRLNLLRKTKKNFCKAPDEKQVFDSKTLWKNVKPFFSDNGVNSSKITLVEKKRNCSR